MCSYICVSFLCCGPDFCERDGLNMGLPQVIKRFIIKLAVRKKALGNLVCVVERSSGLVLSCSRKSFLQVGFDKRFNAQQGGRLERRALSLEQTLGVGTRDSTMSRRKGTIAVTRLDISGTRGLERTGVDTRVHLPSTLTLAMWELGFSQSSSAHVACSGRVHGVVDVRDRGGEVDTKPSLAGRSVAGGLSVCQ